MIIRLVLISRTPLFYPWNSQAEKTLYESQYYPYFGEDFFRTGTNSDNYGKKVIAAQRQTFESPFTPYFGDRFFSWGENYPSNWNTYPVPFTHMVRYGSSGVALQAANGQYVCAEGGGGDGVVANRNAIGPWEKFVLINLGNGNTALRAANGQYVCAEGGGGREVVANRNAIGAWETFRLIPS